MAPPRTPLFSFDPGWLWVLAGLSLLVACMIVPAIDDLRQAEYRRDLARALETHASTSLNRHLSEREALANPSDRMVLSLAATHLNLAPAGTITLLPEGAIALSDASPFEGLTPEFVAPAPPPAPDSILQRLLTNSGTRVWVAAFALLCIFYGLLPPALARGETTRRTQAEAQEEASYDEDDVSEEEVVDEDAEDEYDEAYEDEIEDEEADEDDGEDDDEYEYEYEEDEEFEEAEDEEETEVRPAQPA